MEQFLKIKNNSWVHHNYFRLSSELLLNNPICYVIQIDMKYVS